MEGSKARRIGAVVLSGVLAASAEVPFPMQIPSFVPRTVSASSLLHEDHRERLVYPETLTEFATTENQADQIRKWADSGFDPVLRVDIPGWSAGEVLTFADGKVEFSLIYRIQGHLQEALRVWITLPKDHEKNLKGLKPNASIPPGKEIQTTARYDEKGKPELYYKGLTP